MLFVTLNSNMHTYKYIRKHSYTCYCYVNKIIIYYVICSLNNAYKKLKTIILLIYKCITSRQYIHFNFQSASNQLVLCACRLVLVNVVWRLIERHCIRQETRVAFIDCQSINGGILKCAAERIVSDQHSQAFFSNQAICGKIIVVSIIMKHMRRGLSDVALVLKTSLTFYKENSKKKLSCEYSRWHNII